MSNVTVRARELLKGIRQGRYYARWNPYPGGNIGYSHIYVTDDESYEHDLCAIHLHNQSETRALAQFFAASPELVQDLCKEIVQLREMLTSFVLYTNMRLAPSDLWYCPFCKSRHKNLTELEEGRHHKEECPYATARSFLDGL